MRLKDHVAVVTGGASGFGARIAERFTDEGARVVIADVNAAAGEALAAALRARGPGALFHRTDVARDADWAALVAATTDAFGRLDTVVNNAGISHRNRPMLEVDEAEFDRVFAVNVKSIYLSARHCLPVFRRLGPGSFVNIGSTAAVRPRPGLTWYSGSKGAVALLTKAMAVELAPERIRVNAIHPALAETPLLATFLGAPDDEATRARFLPSIPLGRFGRPSDVANAALFLAEPASEFITGVCLEVDGGRCV
jgi:3-oxoacyl-[acyl-carrier protein] reductase